jgi:hypothetical protein
MMLRSGVGAGQLVQADKEKKNKALVGENGGKKAEAYKNGSSPATYRHVSFNLDPLVCFVVNMRSKFICRANPELSTSTITRNSNCILP